MVDPNPFAKRMRLGTKSCAECRRRKIRCIFNDGIKSCKACQLHNTECEAQGSKTNTPKAADFDEIKTRLERLELLMDKVCDAADLKDGSKPNDLEASMSTLIDRLCAERGRASPGSPPRKGLASYERLEPDVFPDVSSEQATGAPLMKFIKATSIIAEEESTNTGSECDLMTNVSKSDIYRILPSSSEMVRILEATSIYWPLWPLHPSQLSPSTNLSLSVVTIARSFIEESIESGRPAIMARALMWFALCVQQVPSSDTGDVASRKMSSSAAVMRYLNMSDSLLGPDVQADFTTAGLTCLVLQAKCYVNMGRVRQAWLAIRRAVNQALVLGFHNSQRQLGYEDTRTWQTIWAYDCQLSLLIGVPSAVPAACSPNLDGLVNDMPLEAKMMHHISSLCADISSRNLNSQQCSYADTMLLDEKLERLRAMVPDDRWRLDLAQGIPLEIFHARQTSKLYLHHLKQLVHLPYMLKAITETRYQYSRASVLEALEDMMQCYAETKRHPEGLYVMCFLVDFLAFSAGLILAADILSQQSIWDRDIEARKWQSIRGLVSELKVAATLLDHTVARQSAQLLEYLDSARNGTYIGPDSYDAVIPYFGKVRIRRPQARNSPAVDGPRAEPPDVAGMVTFDSDIYDFTVPTGLVGNELDTDWESFLEDHATYDWSGVFEF